MIRLLTENGDLDLLPSTTINWVIQNSFFEDGDSFVPQLALPFTLPITPNNENLLQFSNHFQVSGYDLSIRITMLIGGVVWFRGMLNLIEPSDEGFSCSLGYDRKELDTSKSLRIFDYGGVRTGSCTDAKRTADNTKTYPEIDYAWPHVWNAEPTKNIAFNHGGSSLINDFSYGYYNAMELASPMPFLVYVLKQIFTEMGGITVVGKLLESSDFLKKLIYNPVVTNTMTNEKLEMYVEYDANFHAYNVSDRVLKIGIHNATTMNLAIGASVIFEIEEYPNLAHSPKTTHVVFYTVVAGDVGNSEQFLKNIWAYIQTLSGSFTLASENWADANEPFLFFKEAAHFSSNTLFSPLITNGNILTRAVNYNSSGGFTYNDVLLSKHMPDISVKEFIDAIKDAFNCTLFFNSVTKVLIFTPRKFQTQNLEYKNYTSKVNIGYKKEILKTQRYKFVFQNDKSDSAIDAEEDWCAKNYKNWDAADVQEIQIGLGHVKRYSNLPNGALGALGDMCFVKQQLYKYSDTETPKFSLRLMHWQGMVNDSFSNPYPKADDYFLTPDQLYTLWYSEWYRATILGREIPEFKIMLTMDDILNFDPTLKWKIFHNNYIWKEIVMPISMKGIGESTVKLMRIPSNSNTFNTLSGEALGD